jgi:sugar lactone lactonase YvrE
VKTKLTREKQNKEAIMKTKLTDTKFKSALGLVGQLFSSVACLGAVILICSSASAQNLSQNLFVSGYACSGEIPDPAACGKIFKFTWEGQQSIFVSGLNYPGDLTVDGGGCLFVVECEPCWTTHPGSAIYKINPIGVRTRFAFGLTYSPFLAADRAGNLFVADYDDGIIYRYSPSGSRTSFASGLYHPTGMAVDSAGKLFVADNSMGNFYQGSIYAYKPDGSRVTFAVLDPSDRPADLAFDSMRNLFMADLGGNIYKYYLHGVRTTFGSVPNSAQSLACDNAGNLFVLDASGIIYKFTPQGARSTFASGPFSHVAF